jgi:hypothetical protein
LARLFEDEGLRRVQIKKGVENVSRFSWKKAANETVEVLRNAIDLSPKLVPIKMRKLMV